MYLKHGWIVGSVCLFGWPACAPIVEPAVPRQRKKRIFANARVSKKLDYEVVTLDVLAGGWSASWSGMHRIGGKHAVAAAQAGPQANAVKA